jgi:transcriptional regulator with XRE-family HTH domain
MNRTESTKSTLPVIARRLREARLRAGISQKILGIRAGFDQFTSSPRINQYERGKHTPDFQTLEKFAEVLSVPTEFFYARDDSTAEMLLLYSSLSQRKRTQMMSTLKKLAGVDLISIGKKK